MFVVFGEVWYDTGSYGDTVLRGIIVLGDLAPDAASAGQLFCRRQFSDVMVRDSAVYGVL